MHDSLRPAGISKRARDFRDTPGASASPQHRFRQQRQFRFDFVEFQVARDVGDRDAQKLLMAKGADRIEPRLEIRCMRSPDPRARAPAPRGCAGAATRSERTSVSSISGWRMNRRRQVAARGEQAQQHAARRRMLLEQREERGARADRRDEIGQISQRQIRIGQAADLVEQNRPERFQQLGAARDSPGACGLPRARISRLAALSSGCAKPSAASPRSAIARSRDRAPRRARGIGNLVRLSSSPPASVSRN